MSVNNQPGRRKYETKDQDTRSRLPNGYLTGGMVYCVSRSRVRDLLTDFWMLVWFIVFGGSRLLNGLPNGYLTAGMVYCIARSRVRDFLTDFWLLVWFIVFGGHEFATC